MSSLTSTDFLLYYSIKMTVLKMSVYHVELLIWLRNFLNAKQQISKYAHITIDFLISKQ